MRNRIIIALLAILAAPVASAELLWSDNSWSFLQGSGYKVGDDEKNVLTIEHASGHTWGSTFLFFDRLENRNSSGKETYGEIGANFDIVKLDAFLNKIFIATQAEFTASSSNQNDNYLYGVGVGLDVPGAKYFNIMYYLRSNGGTADDNEQITLTWAVPIADGLFQYDGFLDAPTSSSTAASSLNFTSQLKWDLGNTALGMKPGKLWLGFEFAYWNNKFGIQDTPGFRTDERATSLLVKWHM